MLQRVKAVYHRGAFVPKTRCDIPEGSEVEITVEGPHILPPGEKDPRKRAKILKALVKRMRENPLPKDAPRFTREEMHDRR